jgi:tripartite-type tricarboxylate transporter receptor subunit TctC
VNGAVVYPSDVEANKDDLRVLVYFGDGTDDLKNEGVPSIADMGIQLQVGHNLYALIAPKSLPEDVLKKLDEAFKVALEEPELISKFNDLGVTPSYSPSEELQKELTTISDSIGEILKQLENVQ